MLRRSAAVTLAVLVLFAPGCTKADKAVSKDLEEDLRQAEVTAVEMAPSSDGRIEVAHEFIAGEGKAPSRKAVTTTTAAAKDSVIETLAKSPEGDPISKLDSTVMSRRPRPVQQPTPTRTGPYKSTSDVIRDAPFPIKP